MQEVIVDDVEPNADKKMPGREMFLRGSIAVRGWNNVVRTIIVEPRGAAFVKLWIVELGIPMAFEPDKPLERSVKTINEKMSHSDDQQSFPRGCQQQKTGGVDQDMNKAWNRSLGFVQCHIIRLKEKVPE
jgi:hypothetical protein